MSNLADDARPAVEELLEGDADSLFEELEARRRMISSDPSQAGSFRPAVSSLESVGAFSAEQLNEFGRRFFARVSQDIYKLVCGDAEESQGERQALLKALGVGHTTFAAMLAATLVSQFGWAPALAAVLAALTVKLFFNNAYSVACGMWKESMTASNNS